jgi:hypothetical protein
MSEIGTLYRVNGEILKILPINGHTFTGEELEAYVGGFIELVPGTARRGKPAAYCKENNRYLGDIQVNPFFRELVGNVVQVRKGNRKTGT